MNAQEFLIAFPKQLNAIFESCQQFGAASEQRHAEAIGQVEAAQAAMLAQAEQAKQATAARPSGYMPLAIDAEITPADDANLQLDMALFNAAPVAVVPTKLVFVPLSENGHRFLIGRDGMYLEVRRPWLYFVRQIAPQTAVKMPFGHIMPCTELAFGRLSAVIGQIQAFVALARKSAPLENAALLMWNDLSQSLQALPLAFTRPPAVDSVQYEHRPLQDHESIAIDLHSHGHLPAFFSETDDADDAGSVKISGVIGDLDKEQPSAMFRLCVLGLYITIPVPAAVLFAEPQP